MLFISSLALSAQKNGQRATQLSLNLQLIDSSTKMPVRGAHVRVTDLDGKVLRDSMSYNIVKTKDGFSERVDYIDVFSYCDTVVIDVTARGYAPLTRPRQN